MRPWINKCQSFLDRNQMMREQNRGLKKAKAGKENPHIHRESMGLAEDLEGTRDSGVYRKRTAWSLVFPCEGTRDTQGGLDSDVLPAVRERG